MTTKEIKVFSTPSCPYCHMAKEYFDKHNVKYQDYDVSVDLEARNEMVEKSGQMGVPVIIIDEEVIVGFNKPRIDEILEIN